MKVKVSLEEYEIWKNSLEKKTVVNIPIFTEGDKVAPIDEDYDVEDDFMMIEENVREIDKEISEKINKEQSGSYPEDGCCGMEKLLLLDVVSNVQKEYSELTTMEILFGEVIESLDGDGDANSVSLPPDLELSTTTSSGSSSLPPSPLGNPPKLSPQNRDGHDVITDLMISPPHLQQETFEDEDIQLIYPFVSSPASNMRMVEPSKVLPEFIHRQKEEIRANNANGVTETEKRSINEPAPALSLCSHEDPSSLSPLSLSLSQETPETSENSFSPISSSSDNALTSFTDYGSNASSSSSLIHQATKNLIDHRNADSLNHLQRTSSNVEADGDAQNNTLDMDVPDLYKSIQEFLKLYETDYEKSNVGDDRFPSFNEIRKHRLPRSAFVEHMTTTGIVTYVVEDSSATVASGLNQVNTNLQTTRSNKRQTLEIDPIPPQSMLSSLLQKRPKQNHCVQEREESSASFKFNLLQNYLQNPPPPRMPTGYSAPTPPPVSQYPHQSESLVAVRIPKQQFMRQPFQFASNNNAGIPDKSVFKVPRPVCQALGRSRPRAGATHTKLPKQQQVAPPPPYHTQYMARPSPSFTPGDNSLYNAYVKDPLEQSQFSSAYGNRFPKTTQTNEFFAGINYQKPLFTSELGARVSQVQSSMSSGFPLSPVQANQDRLGAVETQQQLQLQQSVPYPVSSPAHAAVQSRNTVSTCSIRMHQANYAQYAPTGPNATGAQTEPNNVLQNRMFQFTQLNSMRSSNSVLQQVANYQSSFRSNHSQQIPLAYEQSAPQQIQSQLHQPISQNTATSAAMSSCISTLDQTTNVESRSTNLTTNTPVNPNQGFSPASYMRGSSLASESVNVEGVVGNVAPRSRLPRGPEYGSSDQQQMSEFASQYRRFKEHQIQRETYHQLVQKNFCSSPQSPSPSMALAPSERIAYSPMMRQFAQQQPHPLLSTASSSSVPGHLFNGLSGPRHFFQQIRHQLRRDSDTPFAISQQQMRQSDSAISVSQTNRDSGTPFSMVQQHHLSHHQFSRIRSSSSSALVGRSNAFTHGQFGRETPQVSIRPQNHNFLGLASLPALPQLPSSPQYSMPPEVISGGEIALYRPRENRPQLISHGSPPVRNNSHSHINNCWFVGDDEAIDVPITIIGNRTPMPISVTSPRHGRNTVTGPGKVNHLKGRGQR